MPDDDLDKALRSIRKGVEGTARAEPVVAAGEAIAKIGDFVIKHTPKPIKRVGRKVRRKVSEALQRRRARRMKDGT